MSAPDPAQRRMLARRAALVRHAHGDTVAATAPARAAQRARYERAVDPTGTMDPAERAVRVGRLVRAHMQDLARRRWHR